MTVSVYGGDAPPHNSAVEASLLGEVLNHADLAAVRTVLGDSGGAFYEPFHGTVYAAAVALHSAGRPVDGATVGAALNGAGQSARFVDLVSAGGLATDAPLHALEVARLYQQRRLVEELVRGQQLVIRDPGRVAEVIASLQLLAAAAVAPGEHQAPWTGSGLLAATFDPIRWAVPGLIPSGLCLVVGSPKMGKSWVVLDIALAIATGGVTLGRGEQGLAVEAGDVLYLALEDGPRRIQTRLRALLDGRGDPNLDRLHVRFVWAKDAAAAKLAEAWLDEHPDARMIVVDTLGRIRDDASKLGNAYGHDTSAISPWQRLATERNVAIVFVHHVRKAKSDDFVTEVSGTNGIAGVADVTVSLDRARLDTEATLRVTGRDVEEREYTIRQTRTGWELTGAPPEDPNLGDLSNLILGVLDRHPDGIAPSRIAALLARPLNQVTQYLGRLEDSERARRRGRGVWVLGGPLQKGLASGVLESFSTNSKAIQAPDSHMRAGARAREYTPEAEKSIVVRRAEVSASIAAARARATAAGVPTEEPIPDEYL